MKKFPAPRSRRGVALILALCALVLASALVLLFFSRSVLNRQIAFSSSNQVKADVLARSTGDLIVSEIRNEIIDPTHSNPLNGGNSSYPTFYQPKTTADAVPRLLGVASATGPIVRVSASGVPIQPTGTIKASSIGIDTPSLNGRYISSNRWFTSASGSPELGSQSTLPTWLLVTRSDSVTTPTIANAQNPTSIDYVIGRFAYTVYDVGGLPNANVAGSPTADVADVPFKSSPAYADLTAFGLTSAAATNIVAWRNAATATDAPTFREWATAIPRTSGTTNAAALASAFSGHLSAATGDNPVMTRHDMLQNTNFSSVPADFTHFSRSANYPSYSPATPTTINPNLADVRFANAGTITHYRDDGTAITYTVAAGDPLLQHRFSLAKLAWLTYKGPSADLATTDSLYNAGGTDANIAACFGLTWDTTTDTSNPHWDYTAEDSSTATIKTLSAVAAEGREPNFFEMLRAGIADGSIGTASTNGTLNNYPSEQTLEGSSDLQILQIGANIIDCADTDNYPTMITLKAGAVYTPVYGQEDLPSLYRMITGQVSSVTELGDTTGTTTSTLDWATLYITPQIFNPNRSGITPSVTPSNIRIAIANGGPDRVFNVRSNLTATAPLANWYLTTSLTSDPPIVIPSSNYETFRSTIKIPTSSDASSPTTLSTLITSPDQIDPTIGTQHGFIYFAYAPTETFTSVDGHWGSVAAGSMITFRSYASSLIFDMEYQDAAGGWHTYDTFTGNKAFAGTGSGLGDPAYSLKEIEFLPPDYSPGATTVPDNLDYFEKMDPRTTRWGISGGQYYNNSKTSEWIYTAANAGATRGVKSLLPFGSGSPGSGQSFFPEALVQGGKSAASDWNDTTLNTTTNIHDKDGVLRPADEWLSPSATKNNPNNLFANLTVTNGSNRPMILQRPFRSVAELGYVFRDTPWKTLNFFDETSGDAALLDLFSVADEPTVSQGRVNLDATIASVQQSLLSGVAQSYDGTGTLSSPSSVATAFNGYAFSSGTPTTSMPFTVAGLPAFMDSTSLTNAYTPTSTPDKQQRESVVRALAGNTQTRTWNLLVDVVAQTGHYPSTASTLNDFLVDGEKRYWLFVAIDRYTGKIVDRQLEPVDE